MTAAIGAFLALTVTLAASVVLYLANVRLVRREALGWKQSLAAPVSAWRLGARALPLAFIASLVLYGALQLSLHTIGPW